MIRASCGPLVLSILLFAPIADAETVRESHPLLGAILEITVESEDRETAQNRIRDAVVVGRRLETQLDIAAGESAVSKLNARAGRGSVRLPLDVYRLLAFSQLMTRSTGGAFDVTVGPLVHRRQASERGARINVGEALSLVGADRIVLHPPDGAELADAGMSVDFAAVSRGYTLQRMSAMLRASGVTKALLELGDLAVLAVGPPPGDPPFRVWVRHGKSTAGSVALRDRALSTTRARRRAEADGPMIVDPRSGRFVDSERQATVIARDGAVADAWSTALVVDPDGSLGLLEEPRDVEALVFDEHGEHTSPRFVEVAGWKVGRPAGQSEDETQRTPDRVRSERASEVEKPEQQPATPGRAREPVPRDASPDREAKPDEGTGKPREESADPAREDPTLRPGDGGDAVQRAE